MLTLTVSHNIFLTKKQRYELSVVESTLEAIGISFPVWFHKGKTSEPAKEVFCKYILSINDKKKAISKYSEGYIVNLPKYLDKISMPIFDALKDEKDGGREMLQYKEYSSSKIKSTRYNIIHIVEIYDKSVLLDSII